MRKSQWKPVPVKKQSYKFCYFIEDPQEQKEQHQTSDGEQERPALTVGDLRKKFEPQKTNRPQRKNDDHGKTFGTGYKSHVLHSGVDQNRNVPNQDILGNKIEPQERSGEQGRPALTVGDLLKIYEPQKTNRTQRKNDYHGKAFVQDQNGTGYKSHVFPLCVNQNRNVPNQGNKIGPQRKNEVHDQNEKTPVKSEDPQEKNGRPALTVGDLLKIYEPQKTNRPQTESEVQDQNSTGYKPPELHSGVDPKRNIPNQGTGYKSHVLHSDVDQKGNVSNQGFLGNEFAPQERSEKTPVKSVKGEQNIDKLQIKIDDLQKKIDDLLKQIGDLLRKLDKGEQDKGVLWEKIDKIKQEKDKTALEKDKIEQEKDKIAQEKEALWHDLEQLKKEIERKKAQFKSSWREIPLYADWRKEEFQIVNLTLDAATAHSALFLSEEGRRITWLEPCQDLPSSPERFVSLPCVLGQLHVSSGRYFWEVEVQNAHSWDLGVCKNNVARSGKVTVSPQNGFWAIRLYSGEYWGLTSPETSLTLKEKPCRVGVFLDYEAGDVSFYNMKDGSHIYTFSKQAFNGGLRPLFRLWSSDSGPLTIVQVE